MPVPRRFDLVQKDDDNLASDELDFDARPCTPEDACLKGAPVYVQERLSGRNTSRATRAIETASKTRRKFLLDISRLGAAI